MIASAEFPISMLHVASLFSPSYFLLSYAAARASFFFDAGECNLYQSIVG